MCVKKFSRSFKLLISAVICFLTFSPPIGTTTALAAEHTSPVTLTTDTTLADGTRITIPSTYQLNDAAMQVLTSGITVTTEPGGTLTINFADGYVADPAYWRAGVGIYMGAASSIDLESVWISSYNHAIYSTEGGYVRVGDDSVLSASGNSAVEATLESKIVIGDNAQITGNVAGDNAVVDAWGGYIELGDNATIVNVGTAHDTNPHIGVKASYYKQAGYDIQGTLTIGESSDIFVSADNSIAVRVDGGILSIGDNAAIRVEGAGSNAIQAESSFYDQNLSGDLYVGSNAQISTTGDRGAAIYAFNPSIVTIDTDATISTKGNQAHAVNAIIGSVTIKSGSTITTEGENAIAVNAQYYGSVNLEGDQTIRVDTDKIEYAIAAGIPFIYYGNTYTGPSYITADGKLDIVGNIYSANASDISMHFRNGSVLTGHTVTSNDGEINFTMSGADSIWNVTQDSFVTSLDMNGGTVNLGYSATNSILTVNELSGGGTFNLKTDIVAGTGDLLSADSSAGSHKLSVQNQGSIATDGTETLTVVETGDGGAEFALANEVSIGAWLYGLRRTDANNNNWELYSTGSSTPGASGAVNTFAGSYLLAYAETQTLMQRLGDLRDTPYLSGFWFRVYGGKFESNSSSFVKGFDMDYGGVQVGYDRKIENSWKGDTYVGGYFGYGKGDLDYNTEHGNTGGNGKVDSKTVGAYATYVQEDGFYADALVKYMWMKNDFDVLDTDGDRVTGDDLSTGGLGISLELGKRFRMAQNDKGGNWYIEPQVQYSYTHQDGGHYYASNGLRIGVDEFTSSIGRLGVLVGYETAKTNFYAKASFVKEFDGDVNIVANDIDIPESFGDSWWVYGLGFTSKLNDRNNIYMSLERSDGGKFDEPWKIFAGWRISF